MSSKAARTPRTLQTTARGSGCSVSLSLMTCMHGEANGNEGRGRGRSGCSVSLRPQLDDLVAVGMAHEAVDRLQSAREELAAALPRLRVEDVVRVHNAHHELEAVPPVEAAVVPG